MQVRAAGFEGENAAQPQEALDRASVGESSASIESGTPAGSAKEGQNDQHCHAVTEALEEALRQLENGRLDLGRAAIVHALARLKRGGS